MENTASPLDLFTRLEIALQERDDAADAFDLFKQDAILAPVPDAGADAGAGDAVPVTSDEAADVAAEQAETFDTRADALLRDASDAELAAAYDRSGGDIGNPVADALLGEIERRARG